MQPIFVLFFFILYTLCYQFLWIVLCFLLPLRYSLTFIYIVFCNRQEINEHNAFDSCALDICLRHHIVPLVQMTIPRAKSTVLPSTCPVDSSRMPIRWRDFRLYYGNKCKGMRSFYQRIDRLIHYPITNDVGTVVFVFAW